VARIARKSKADGRDEQITEAARNADGERFCGCGVICRIARMSQVLRDAGDSVIVLRRGGTAASMARAGGRRDERALSLALVVG